MKNKYIMFLVIAATALMLLASCETKENNEMTVPGEYVQGFIADDSKLLDELLTKTYELQELVDYFGEIPNNESSVYGLPVDYSKLNINSVNERFPIECLRQSGYTVYKVNGGGYFYVFWVRTSKPFPAEEPRETGASVYFSAYLSSLRNISDFDSIVEGQSTAYDVAQIDAAFELSFLMSSGICSYSLLENGLVMEIMYDFDGEIKSRSDLIVKSKNVYSKDKRAPAKLAYILAKDLP
jgi:hypothetical protein